MDWSASGLSDKALVFTCALLDAAMLDSSIMNKSGMVTKIHSRIRTEPFKTNYDLVGKELGR